MTDEKKVEEQELDPALEYMRDVALSEDPELAKLQKQFAQAFAKAATESVKSNADELSTLERRMNERIDNLNTQLVEKFMTPSLPGAGPKDNPTKSFSIARLTRGMITGEWAGAEWEREVTTEAAKHARAMGTTPDSAGGYLVPAEYLQNQIIPVLRAQATIFDLGAQEIPLTRSPAFIPKVTGSSTAYWVSENPSSGVTASDLTTGQLRLSHRRVAAKVVVSDDLLDMGEAADAIINEDMGTSLGLELDRAAYKGTGAAGEPLGIVNQIPAANTISFSGVTASHYGYYEKMIDMEHALMNANALRGRIGWAMHPNVFRAIRKIKSENAAAGTDSADVSRQIVSAAAPTTILGYPFRTTTQLTGTSGSADLILGAFNWLLVGRWGGLMLRASNQTSDAMEKFQTHLIASMRLDLGLRYAAGFANGSAVAT